MLISTQAVTTHVYTSSHLPTALGGHSVATASSHHVSPAAPRTHQIHAYSSSFLRTAQGTPAPPPGYTLVSIDSNARARTPHSLPSAVLLSSSSSNNGALATWFRAHNGVAVLLAFISTLVLQATLVALWVSYVRRAPGFHGLKPKHEGCMRWHLVVLMGGVTLCVIVAVGLFAFYPLLTRFYSVGSSHTSSSYFVIGPDHRKACLTLLAINILALCYSLIGHITTPWGGTLRIRRHRQELTPVALRTICWLSLFFGLTLVGLNAGATTWGPHSFDLLHCSIYGTRPSLFINKIFIYLFIHQFIYFV